MIKKFSQTIKELTVSNCSLQLDDLRQLLNFTPKLETLTISYVSISNSNVQTEPTLHNLKTLKFIESDPGFFNLLKFPQFTRVSLEFYEDIYLNFEFFVEFLGNQKQLKHLSLSHMKDSNLFLFDVAQAASCFQLHTLTINDCDFEMEDDSFTRFLKGQTALKELDLQATRFLVENDMEVIFCEMRGLRKLTLKVPNFSFDEKICKGRNLHLVDLTLVGNNSTKIDEMVRCFPNLETLELLKFRDLEDFDKVAEIIEGLENLTIEGCKNKWVENLKFRNLKKLTLNQTHELTIQGFQELVENHPKIEELELTSSFNLNDDILEIILKELNKLNVLIISSDNQLTRNAFNLVDEHCKCLKKFRMEKFCQKFNSDDMKCLGNIPGLSWYCID